MFQYRLLNVINIFTYVVQPSYCLFIPNLSVEPMKTNEDLASIE